MHTKRYAKSPVYCTLVPTLHQHVLASQPLSGWYLQTHFLLPKSYCLVTAYICRYCYMYLFCCWLDRCSDRVANTSHCVRCGQNSSNKATSNLKWNTISRRCRYCVRGERTCLIVFGVARIHQTRLLATWSETQSAAGTDTVWQGSEHVSLCSVWPEFIEQGY